ncbi:MAG: FAD-dependent oxidoreductase [Xanthobacteraceae bacterium]
MNGLVIIGASYAGIHAALSVREAGYSENITIVCDESWLPYERPPLSKDFLLGKATENHLILRDETFFKDRKIDVLLDTRVAKIDRLARRIETHGGALRFGKLLIATGSRARRLAVPGGDLEGICYLRSITDAIYLRAQLLRATDVVIVGGGFIGLEVASSAVRLGKKVTVIESASRLLERAVCQLVSDVLHQMHQEAGVDVRVRDTIMSIDGNHGKVAGVTLSNGERLRADLILVGIGGIANDELAVGTGLTCANGIVVDEYGRTNDPDIHAAGDCASHYSRFADRWIRLESVQNAQDQGKTAGLAVAGRAQPYDAVPRFWSDQHDTKLQMVGLSSCGDDLVVRGSVETGMFSVFHYRKGALVAVDSINRPGDQMVSRRLISAGVSPRPDEAIDESFDLKSLAKTIEKTGARA